MPTATTGHCLVVTVALQRGRTIAATIASVQMHKNHPCVSRFLAFGYCFCRDSRHISPQVYHRRRPTLGLLILPSVSPFSPTIRRTARISFLPTIEPNLAERARISAVNLDDYQLDPVTPPPSPSSPFTMAAYQRMINETDPTQREEALTAYGMETDMDRYPNSCLEELEAFMTLWDVKPRVEECSLEALSVDELIAQLRQMCEDAEDRASNAQEEARQKRKEALEEVVQQIYRNNN
ncbi:hypothetical protein Tco_0781101 [Tanacetum coccineum]